MAASFERIACVQGDITAETVDAIVNAANESLRGGGGVDGAIHRAAGPELLADCIRLYPDGCPTGEARLTDGHALRAKHVIHTVGPIYAGGRSGEREALASCYRNSLELAAQHGLTSLAFPAISCGVYGYPVDEAAEVAIDALGAGLAEHPDIVSVRMVLFSPEVLSSFSAALQARCG